jgi:hypothetical protein
VPGKHERLKPPLELRKAPQTARGFNGWRAAGVHLRRVRPERSAQADITWSLPRFMPIANLIRQS